MSYASLILFLMLLSGFKDSNVIVMVAFRVLLLTFNVQSTIVYSYDFLNAKLDNVFFFVCAKRKQKRWLQRALERGGFGVASLPLCLPLLVTHSENSIYIFMCICTLPFPQLPFVYLRF